MSNDGVVAVRIYFRDETCTPYADLAFASGSATTICWVNVEEKNKYMPRINGYTLFFDERPKADFSRFFNPEKAF